MNSGEPAHWGESIRRAREGEGWSKQAVADALGCSYSQMQKLEKAEKRPVGSRFAAPLEKMLQLGRHSPVADLDVERALLRADKYQLGRALSRLLEAEELAERAERDALRRSAQGVADFDVSDDVLRGTGEPGDPSAGTQQAQANGVNGNGHVNSDDPPTGAVHS